VRIRPRQGEGRWTTAKATVTDVRVDELQLKPNELMGPPPPPQSVYLKVPPLMEGKQILNSQGEVIGTRSTETVIDFVEPCPLPFYSDMRVEVRHGKEDEKLFHFWFNACMIDGPKLILRKWQLDGAAKDRKHKKYSPHFRVELNFTEGGGGGIVPVD